MGLDIVKIIFYERFGIHVFHNHNMKDMLS